ncbi:site-specific DNA-methyltransferase [Clostridioides difficile]|uniref:site-specific DNA-methyltransferase n=1 Tax=Clostridioides difficile TaxID=1496 RepID=UPI002358C849|nr:DNA methyltransferase [Clostridioides difficile]MDC9367139.1 site-specific DNA-methyltransferase [Clostridioides difficile]
MQQHEMIDINALTPYENNARTHSTDQLEMIGNSIKEFGFINPVIIDENNMILVGHGRVMAADQIGIKQVPFRRVTNLTEDQKKAYIIADNKLSDLGGWDDELLLAELESIELDMSQFGFDLEIDDIEDPDIVEDDPPDVDADAEPKSKRGDVYQLGDHFLMCGDSTDPDDVTKLLRGGQPAASISPVTIDLLLTDPPYGVNAVNTDGKIGGDKEAFGKIGGNNIVEANTYMPIKGDDTTETAKKSYQIIKELTKEQIIFGGNYFTDFLPPRACWCVWDKENSGNFADVELAWTSFNKGAKLYHFMWNGMAREGSRKIEGIKRIHPTQKPVGLIGQILNDFSKENDLIADIFGGSGSTLIACEQLNRKCYMMEYEPYYVDVIIERWENFTGRKAVRI